MGAAVSLYRYFRLSDPKRQIRLLHVRSSSNYDDPIHSSLSVHDLDKSLDFTALSYEWGRAPEKNDDKDVIRINYLWTRPIQANLDKALRHLRRPDKTLVVWVDAICIDQSDRGILEKADQVSIMARIYGFASQTYVWIGPSADDSDVAMTTLRKVGETMLKEENGVSPRKRFEDLTKDAPAGQWNKQSPDELLQLAPDMIQEYIPNASFCSAECRLLLSRSYWTRMWIQQEVVLSPRPIICCGSTQVDWNEFEAGLVFINLLKHHAVYGTLSKYGSTNIAFDFSKWIKSDEKNYEKRYFHPQWTVEESKNYEELGLGWNFEATALRRLRNRWSPASLPLLRVIAEEHAGVARHEVSRQEDRIYGLAGMASDIPRLEQFGFKINYKIPCRESYANVARAIILSGDVDLLALSNPSKFERMPSWVPDWRTPIPKPRGGYPWETRFSVSKNLQGPDNFPTCADELCAAAEQCAHKQWDDPLLLEGCIIDRVNHMNEPWRPGAYGCRGQARLTRGFLLDVQNIIWMSGQRQEKSGKWVINRETGADGALWRLAVADQHQGSNLDREKESEYLFQGYLAVMKDLDKNFVIDTRMWAMFRKSFNVEFDGFPTPGDMKPFPPTEETAAEFNVKDSYYNMMDRQSGTRPFVGDIGYFGLVPELTEHGDIVVLLKNAKLPYVLRKKANGKHAGKYELVGEAYVHGVMYGEYLAGNPEFVQFELV